MSSAHPHSPLPASEVSDRLARITAHAHRLMRDLGVQELGSPLQDLGWRFGFDRARRRLGSCRWKGKRQLKSITVSRFYASHLGLEYRDAHGLAVIDDVIRHEIAHAVDFEKRGRSDHSSVWKSICRRIGADPTRLYEAGRLNDVEMPGKYSAQCRSCGREVTFYRAPRRPRACRSCCDEHARGRYDERFRLVVTRRY